jgi:hypothetical protein
MYEAQRFVDLQQNSSNFGDPKSWLSEDSNSKSSPTHHPNHSQLASSAGGNVDRVLFNDLVEMVPLVQSLIVIISLTHFLVHFILKFKQLSINSVKFLFRIEK